ncbi:MAG: thioredoxin [Actinobacteria bacterium]|nr:thioredoxin [Actinomycetota bacterium]
MADTGLVACPSCGARNRTPVASTGLPRCGKCKAELPWLVPADDSTVAGALDAKPLVILDLWAPWCGPCRMVAPVLEQLSSDYAGRTKVVKVNVDDSPATAARYEASSIPTLVILDRGKVVERIIGAQPKPALAAAIDRALAGR